MKKIKEYIEPECENWEKHSQQPEGYNNWHAWAKEKSKTHMQIKCPGCNRYEIWVKSTLPTKTKRK